MILHNSTRKAMSGTRDGETVYALVQGFGIFLKVVVSHVRNLSIMMRRRQRSDERPEHAYLDFDELVPVLLADVLVVAGIILKGFQLRFVRTQLSADV